jgi:hypothetical protein
VVNEHPVYELTEWFEECAAVIRQDRFMPSAGHKAEDKLVERFVRDAAWQKDGSPLGEKALALVKVFDNPARRRHYA